MDRFIEIKIILILSDFCHLKSNMDRFIALSFYFANRLQKTFKIQYG